MKKEEFEQEIKALIPQPSQERTDALYEMALDALENKGPQDIINAFDFIARHFDLDVLQKSYEIIQHGSAALPGELVAAAVFLQNGDPPRAHVADGQRWISDVLSLSQRKGGAQSISALLCD